MDYALFEALSGPLANAGLIQQQREQQQLQQLQIQERQRQLQLQQLDKQKRIQSDLNKFAEAAQKDLYTKTNFSRQKDLDDFRDWHNELSGWSDIQNVLREYGSIDNARVSGNLDYMLGEYMERVKNNPISRRVNKNKAALELYHSFLQDKEGNARFLTQGVKQRYADYLAGNRDNFPFYGGRADYLGESIKGHLVTDQIDLDDVLNRNESAIRIDMINDGNLNPNTRFTRDEMKNYLKRELQATEFNGITYFQGKPYYGEQEVELDAAGEINNMLEGVQAIKGSDYFQTYNLDEGRTFAQDFVASGSDQQFTKFGGTTDETMFDYSDDNYGFLTKGTQTVGSTRVFTDPDMETKLARAHFGKSGDKYLYNEQDRTLGKVSMRGLFTEKGSIINSQDIDKFFGDAGKSGIPFEEDFIGENEFMRGLQLEGYFVGFRGKSADGEDVLLTDVTNEEDRKKLMNAYKDVVFEPVLVAELRDEDYLLLGGADDRYYSVVDMGNYGVRERLQQEMPLDDTSDALNKAATYEKRKAENDYFAQKKVANQIRLQQMLEQPDEKSTEQLVNGYDQQLTVTLGMSGVASGQIQQAIPLLIADLYVDSQLKRTYPFDFTPNESDPRKKKIANSPGEYMAYATMQLKEGLMSGNPAYQAMLEAIRTGNYNQFSRTLYDGKSFKKRRMLSKQINLYQRGR